MNPFWRRHAVLPALAFVAVTALLEATRIDLAVAELFFDPTQHRWTWGESWWTNQLLHQGGLALIIAFGVAVLSAFIASFRIARLRPHRHAALFVALCIATGPYVVARGKQSTNVDCPRELECFGGRKPYIRLFEDKPDDARVGHCFPAGHASGAYSLVAFYFALRERRARDAHLALGGALLLGLAFSAGQWARGVHFLSHDVWSLAICWFVALAYYAGFGGALYPGDGA